MIAATGPGVFRFWPCIREETTEARADRDRGKEAFTALFTQCSQLMMAIVRHPPAGDRRSPGLATAAGCQLVASCDLAMAADTAKFATPGDNIGLFCSTPMVAPSRNVPRNRRGDGDAADRPERDGTGSGGDWTGSIAPFPPPS